MGKRRRPDQQDALTEQDPQLLRRLAEQYGQGLPPLAEVGENPEPLLHYSIGRVALGYPFLRLHRAIIRHCNKTSQRTGVDVRFHPNLYPLGVTQATAELVQRCLGPDAHNKRKIANILAGISFEQDQITVGCTRGDSTLMSSRSATSGVVWMKLRVNQHNTYLFDERKTILRALGKEISPKKEPRILIGVGTILESPDGYEDELRQAVASALPRSLTLEEPTPIPWRVDEKYAALLYARSGDVTD